MSLLALFSIPMGVGIMATADPFVRLVMGPKWIDVIPLIQVLALVGALNAIVANNGSVYLAIGKPRIPTILMGCSVVVLIPTLIWSTARAGALGAGYTLLGVAVVLLPIEFTILLRVLGLRASRVAAALWRPLAAASVMYLSVSTLLHRIPVTDDLPGQFLRLGASVATGIVVYTATISTLWVLSSRPDSGEQIALQFMKRKLGRKPTPQPKPEPEG
jgi:O-antigen/teichoic acid export membrane protein